MATAASSLPIEPTHGSPEECSSCGPGQAATATAHQGEDAVEPQGTAPTPTSSLEFEPTSGMPEECGSGSPGKTMDATVSKGDTDTDADADSSYVLVDHAESDETGEGDMHVIGEVMVSDEGEVDSEVKDNCQQNFDTVAEDLDVNSSPSPLAEDDEDEMRKAFENDILLQVISAAEVESKSCSVPTMGEPLVADSIHIEQHQNDLIPSASSEVTNAGDDNKDSEVINVGNDNNDSADSDLANTPPCEAEVVRSEVGESVLPCNEYTDEFTWITVETCPSVDEKTTTRDVKFSLRDDEISNSSPGNFLHMPDDSFDVETSCDMKDSIPPVDCQDKQKCDANDGISGAISADSIADSEADKLGTCEVVMDRPDCEQPEEENSNDVNANNNENNAQEVVGDNVSSSSADDNVGDDNNDSADSVLANTTPCEAEVVRSEVVESVLPSDETCPSVHEKTTTRDVKFSSGNDEISKSSPGNFLHMPDDSFDAETSCDMNDSIPSIDCHDKQKLDANDGISRAISADSIANSEADKLGTCEVVMDCPDGEQPEEENSNGLNVNNNENNAQEVVVDNVSSSSVDDNVGDDYNDSAVSVLANTTPCEAEAVRSEVVEHILPSVETCPSVHEKTTRDVKFSSWNDEISKSSPGNFLHMPDNSFDAEISCDMNDSIPPIDCHDKQKCDVNDGISRAISADSIANLEADKLGTCEVVMDCPDREQPEEENSNGLNANNNENNVQEVVINNVSPSSVDDDTYLVTNSKIYMIRVPRILDSKLSRQVDLAQQQLEERTHQRDSVRKELQNKKAICNAYGKDFNDAKEEEKAARLAFSMKCKEVEKLKSMVADINARGHVDNIAREMQHLEHSLQHETMSLKEEKLLLRRIKELKQNHASLSLKLGTNSELNKALEEKTQIEEQIKHLSLELETLRNKLFQAKTRTDTSKKKCDEGYNILREVQAQHKAADDLRQQAYMNMRNLKKEFSLKNKHFYKYKDDVNVAASYASSGNLKALQKHCIQQVETIMKLWNENDEFRKSYVLSNQLSTIRRFKTLDGRSLGPDEEPATLPTIRRNPTTDATVLLKAKTALHDESAHENVGKTLVSADANCFSMNMEQKKTFDETSKKSTSKLEITSALDVVEQKEDKSAKPDDEIVTTISSEDLARMELIKQQAAEESKAKIIAEQKAKRKEAEERKRRKAEKAKALADLRAQREAELREKKRTKKRTENASCENDTTSVASNVETPACATKVVESPEDRHIVSEKTSTFSSASRSYYKVKPLPPPLRYKGKRKGHMLTWVLLSVGLVILFWVGIHLSLYHI